MIRFTVVSARVPATGTSGFAMIVMIGIVVMLGGCASLHDGVVTASGNGFVLPEVPSGTEVVMIPALPDRGFQVEYFLYIPGDIRRGDPVRLLVQSNNTGRVSDSHRMHRDRARTDAESGWARYVAEALSVPLLVPAFDRPEVIGMTYTHALDRDTLEIADGRQERIDLQLLAMIDHASELLATEGIAVEDRVWMFGFSASGNFANRFAAIHPRRVRAVATGGVNGMPVIPAEIREGRSIPYHVGLGDLADLTGHRFDGCRYRMVSQYIFMGETDENDTIPYGDAYNEAERRITVELLGQKMAERWLRSQEIYRELEIPAQFVTYRGVGHGMNPAIAGDVVAFFRANDSQGFAAIMPSAPTAEGLAAR